MPRIHYPGFIHTGGRVHLPPFGILTTFDTEGNAEVSDEVAEATVGVLPHYSRVADPSLETSVPEEITESNQTHVEAQEGPLTPEVDLDVNSNEIEPAEAIVEADADPGKDAAPVVKETTKDKQRRRK